MCLVGGQGALARGLSRIPYLELARNGSRSQSVSRSLRPIPLTLIMFSVGQKVSVLYEFAVGE